MFFVFEISRPLQLKPYFYNGNGVTTIFRVCWLWFALSIHPMRWDELIDLALSGEYKLEEKS